jgi:ubiquitin C-terminal hydrolase
MLSVIISNVEGATDTKLKAECCHRVSTQLQLNTGLFISPSGISELDCAIFRHDYPLAVEPASTPSTKKNLERFSTY